MTILISHGFDPIYSMHISSETPDYRTTLGNLCAKLGLCGIRISRALRKPQIDGEIRVSPEPMGPFPDGWPLFWSSYITSEGLAGQVWRAICLQRSRNINTSADNISWMPRFAWRVSPVGFCRSVIWWRHGCRSRRGNDQQTQNICITFIQCWSSVEDVGPTL